MNSPAQKVGSAAPETAPIVAETRQESVVLTGNYAGSVEAILLDYEIAEKLVFIEEKLALAKELLESPATHDEGVKVFGRANAALNEVEKLPLMKIEKARLEKLSHLMVEMGIAFAAGTLPRHLSEMECPR